MNNDQLTMTNGGRCDADRHSHGGFSSEEPDIPRRRGASQLEVLTPQSNENCWQAHWPIVHYSLFIVH